MKIAPPIAEPIQTFGDGYVPGYSPTAAIRFLDLAKI